MREDKDLLQKDVADFLNVSQTNYSKYELGKINIPIEILNKNGKLTDSEFAQMKSHPSKGYEILQRSRGISERARRISLEHHEKYDGSGYPNNLKGSTISLFGRICAVADVYDALVSKRVYKESMSFEKADAIIMDGMGKHFDPRLAACYVSARPALDSYYSSLEA